MTGSGMIGDLNKWIQGSGVVLVPPGARTAGGSGAPAQVWEAHTLRASLAVTAVGGTTPSLTVTLETSADGVSWRSIGSFPAVTGVGTSRLSVSGLDNLVRASWAETGTTPSFTFAVSGELVG
jgi:hypothetical protein